MKSALLVALFAVLAVSALAARDYSFSGNATVSDPDGTLTFRSTAMGAILGKKVAFSSVAIDIDRNGSNTQVNIDTLGGFVSYNRFPGALLSYFTGSLTLDPNNFDAAAAKNLMAKAYYRLDEVDANNNLVHAYSLGANADLDWDLDTGSSANLKWAELNVALQVRGNSSSNFDFTVTFFVSNVIGTLNVVNTVITPRTLESVIRISNYPYASSTNKLVLHLVVAHGEQQFFASGNKISTGQQLQQMSVQLAASCQVSADANNMNSGQDKAVVISSWSSNSTLKAIIEGSDFYASINRKFSTNWDVRTIAITFPANAANIVYDPALAAGSASTMAPFNAAVSVSLPSMFLLAVAAIFGLFVL